MFTSKPWAVYVGITTGALLIYYIFVGWKYFRTEISSLLRSKPQKQQLNSGTLITEAQKTSGSGQQEEIMEEDQQPASQNQALSAQMEDLFEHLASEIEEAHQKNYNRQDLIQMMQMILKEYQALKGTPFQIAINKRIDLECAKYGSIHLSEGDKGQVWRMM